MKRLLLPILGLFFSVLSFSEARAQETNASSIGVNFVLKQGMKPPMRRFYVRLFITNTHDRATWYVTRAYGDKPLTTNSSFKAINPWKRGYMSQNAINGEQFSGKGAFRIIRFIGDSVSREESHSFRAFRLPAGGKLKHYFFPIESWTDITHMEIWEASRLFVNGTTPLEDWLPYVSTSSPETRISQTAQLAPFGESAFRWKEGKGLEDFPKEELTSIVPTVLVKHHIPIKKVPKPIDE